MYWPPSDDTELCRLQWLPFAGTPNPNVVMAQAPAFLVVGLKVLSSSNTCELLIFLNIRPFLPSLNILWWQFLDVGSST